MDGVLIHEDVALPGAAAFVDALHAAGRRYLVLTNNSMFTTDVLSARLRAMGIDLPPERSGRPRWLPPSSCATRCPAGPRT